MVWYYGWHVFPSFCFTCKCYIYTQQRFYFCWRIYSMWKVTTVVLFYGERYMTAVVHQLLHLTDVVQHLGPLWVHSCFAFEDTNWKLLDMFKGTKKPHLQIASNIFTMLKITELLQTKFIQPEVQNFIENLSIKKKVSANIAWIHSKTGIVGTTNTFIQDARFVSLLTEYLGYLPNKCFKFLRLKLNNILYQSSEYTLVHKRNSYTIKYKVSKIYYYGHINSFLEVSEKVYLPGTKMFMSCSISCNFTKFGDHCLNLLQWKLVWCQVGAYFYRFVAKSNYPCYRSYGPSWVMCFYFISW